MTSGSYLNVKTGSSFIFQVSASGNPIPAITESGSLPSGVTFSGTTDVLSGTKTVPQGN